MHVRVPAGEVLALAVADRFGARLAGLALRASPGPRDGMLIARCACVHTAGMRFALDVAFVRWPPAGGSLAVMKVCEQVGPLRVARLHAPRRCTAAIELPAGDAARLGIAPGALLRLASP